MKKIFTLICGAVLACGMTAYAEDVVTFENTGYASEGEAYVGTEPDFLIAGDFMFAYYGAQGYWNGVTFSQKTSNTYAGLSDQYNSITGGGADGSKGFAVCYYSQYNALMDDQYPEIYSSEYDTFYPEYVYVTNTAYAVNSMENGDQFAKKFESNDYLKVIFKGMDDDDEAISTVEYYLASGTNISKTWERVDLSALGKVNYVRMEMVSTDMSYGYYNTPTYFAMDNFKASQGPVTGINDLKVNAEKSYKTIENGQVVIVKGNARYNIMGQEIR